MIDESLEDASDIIDNILTQPLMIPGASGEISLLRAAQEFDPQRSGVSQLRQILLGFLQFPEPTRTMLQEMELLKEELSE